MSEEGKGFAPCRSESEGCPAGQEWFLEATKEGNTNQVHGKGWPLFAPRFLVKGSHCSKEVAKSGEFNISALRPGKITNACVLSTGSYRGLLCLRTGEGRDLFRQL